MTGSESLGARAARSWWSPADPGFFLPRTLGFGWDIFGAVAVKLKLIEPDAERPVRVDTGLRVQAGTVLPTALRRCTSLTWCGPFPARPLPQLGSCRKRQPLDVQAISRRVRSGDDSASRRARGGRPPPRWFRRNVGIAATGTMLASIGAATTAAQPPDRRRWWLDPHW